MVRNFKDKKKVIQLILFVGIFIFILIFYVDKAFVTKQSDLHKMVDVIGKLDGNMTEWSIFAREELEPAQSIEDLEKISKLWGRDFSYFAWEKEETEERWVLTGTYFDKDLQFHEKLQIIANLQDNTLQGFILYELKGSEWNKETVKYTDQTINTLLPQLFRKTPMIFSYIKGNFYHTSKDTANKLAKQLNEEFNGNVTEQLQEDNFVSITTKSSYFENYIQSVKGSFNMQIAVRTGEDHEKTSFVLGTPILTIEY